MNVREVSRGGTTFKVRNDANAEFWMLTDWEAPNYKLIAKHASGKAAFIDVGAWIGPFSLFASKLFPVVHSIEPDPIAFQELQENIALNAAGNIRAHCLALYRNNGTLSLGSDRPGTSITTIYSSRNARTVPCMSLHHFCEREVPQGDLFIKMDVEGAEAFLFDDLEFYLERRPTLLVEFHFNFMPEADLQHLQVQLITLSALYPALVPLLPLNPKTRTHTLMVPS